MASCTGMDTICWAIAVVVILVLVYLGCTEVKRMHSYSSSSSAPACTAKRAAPRSARAAAAESPPASPLSPPLSPPTHTDSRGAMLDDAFAQVPVDPTMTRVVNKDASDISNDFFLQEFHDDDSSSFRPIDKEKAMKSANVRPAQQMKNGRADGAPPARMVGLSPMEFARKTIQRPVTGGGCMSFNDTDARHVLVDNTTNCFSTGNCPWMVA